MRKAGLTPTLSRIDRGRGLGPVLLVTLLVPILVMLLVWQHTSVDRLLVDLEEERDRNQELVGRVNALSLAANRLSSLGQVETRASRELGLRRPGRDHIVDLTFAGDDRTRGVSFRPLVPEANAGIRREREGAGQ